VFVFYQFEKPPVFFNQAEWRRHEQGAEAAKFVAIEARHAAVHAEKLKNIRAWLDVRTSNDPAARSAARAAMIESERTAEAVRKQAKAALIAADPRTPTKDSDYVFITFILSHFPHGTVGLLIAVMFSAALSSKASELNALATTTTIDFWRRFRPLAAADEARNVRVAKWFTAFWGIFAIAFALFASLAENLIEAINILGSIFYGVVLGIFLVAFFLKRVGGTAIFWAALAAQGLVFVLYFSLNISYLWYNFIGCAACVLFSLLIQTSLGGMVRPTVGQAGGFE
jgi:SSS family solute:Na+ symporter